MGKPFIVVVNSTMPLGDDCRNKVALLKEKYDVAAVAVDVLHMTENDITQILGAALYEFPARILKFQLPDWLKTLPIGHWVWAGVVELLRQATDYFVRIRDYEKVVAQFMLNENVESIFIDRVSPGEGRYALH